MSELWLKRFRRGDHTVFKELYDIHADGALRLARVITKDDCLAADAVQEAFIRVYMYREKYKAAKPFKVWFNRILVNESRRILSKRKNEALKNSLLQETHNPYSEMTPSFEKYEALYSALEGMTEDLRIAVVLKYYQGFTEDEIAKVLKIRKSTVKARLYHGRQKLKKALCQEKKRGVYIEKN